MRIARTIAELRDAVRSARAAGKRIGLVPTMGAFHEGHLALMRRAKEATSGGFVVVSLFVNPTQFNDPADLARYPRDEMRDAELARAAGVDLLFAPAPEEVYPPGFATTVEVARLSAPLEGAMRGPEHFRGVATVVTKLLNMVQPDDAFFGQKDAQQALIISRLVRDLDIPARIEICPTVREADGLAMSSRNIRLDPESRRRAPAIARALHDVEARVAAGERDMRRAIDGARSILAEARIDPEYFEAVSADTLDPVAHLGDRTLVALAARVGDVRLIDNVIVSPPTAP